MHHAYIDKFAYQDSFFHRLDARVKLIVVLIFTALVIALPRTSPAVLACYAVGPFAVLVWAGVPLRFVFKHILVISPFVLILALSCPLYDRAPVTVAFGPLTWQTSVGWMRCFTILGKFVVTMLALIALVSTTRFNDLLVGLQKLGMPRLLVIQLGFLYRYIFILIDRAHHILRARAARRLRNMGFGAELRCAGAMLGSLLVRSVDNAEHISIAMQARGFDGSWRTVSKLKIRGADLYFAALAGCYLAALHFLAGPLFG
jgi:cobalt/nickel transport system permease protein